MKKLSTYLFLVLFSFSTPSFAGDIRDFEIEGMSIGDSLLDFMSKKEIMAAEKKATTYENKKFLIIFASLNSEIYEAIQITYKPDDQKYLIHAIDGVLYFRNNIKGCRKKMKEIVKEIEVVLTNTIKSEQNFPHQYDKSGKSMTYGVQFKLESGGVIDAYCTDWSDVMTKKYKFNDSLKVFVGSAEFTENIYK